MEDPHSIRPIRPQRPESLQSSRGLLFQCTCRQEDSELTKHTLFRAFWRGVLRSPELDDCDWLPWATFKIISQLEWGGCLCIWPGPAHLEVFVVFQGIVFFVVTSLSGLTLDRVLPFRPFPYLSSPGNPGQNAKFLSSCEPQFLVLGSWPAVSGRVLRIHREFQTSLGYRVRPYLK